MKKTIYAIFLLFSFSALAGDLYLVCENTKNNMSFTSTINDGAANMIIPGKEGIFFFLQLEKTLNESNSLFKLEITNSKNETLEIKNLAIFEEITIGQFVCAVRD